MELELRDGEYVSDGSGGFVRVSEDKEKLFRALFLLAARRGGFSPEPETGSRLYTLPSVRRTERESAARQFAAEALKDENISVEGVSVSETEDGLSVHFELSCGEADISVNMGGQV